MLGRAIATQFQLQDPDLLAKSLELEPLAQLHPDIPTIRISHDDKPQWKSLDEIEESKLKYQSHRVILLVRDPRDVMVSFYFQHKYRIRDGKQIEGRPIQPYAGDLASHLREPGGALERLLKFYNVWAANQNIPKAFLRVRYEDLHTQPQQELDRVLHFLGLSVGDRILADAVEFAQFDQMRALEQSGQLATSRLTPGDPSNPESFKTRRGEVGGYQHYFSDHDIEYVNQRIAKTLTPEAIALYGYSVIMNDPALHQMNPLERFSDRAEAYARYRPSYPPEAIAQVLDGLGDPRDLVIADMGAGTGISSRLLADQGATVIAIEPNAAMREVADPHPRVEFRDTNAEQTGLATNSVHLITCFQAFHWFEPESALPEFHRILQPQGRLAVIWNQRDRTDPCTEHYTQIIKQASQHHPAESRLTAIQPLFSTSLFTNLQTITVPYQQALDEAGLMGRALSTSYIPQQGSLHKQLQDDLKTLYNHFRNPQGVVYLTYQTTLYLVDKLE